MSMRRIAAVVLTLGSLASGAWSADVDKALDLARKTLALVERSAARPKLAAELAALEKRYAQAKAAGRVDKNAVYAEARELRRRIILSHPSLDFADLLINKRTGRLPGHMCDQYLGRHSSPGPGLVVLESWKTAPTARLLLKGKLPDGTVVHPDLSFDAKRVVFSYCNSSTKGPRERRSYFIYEVTIDAGRVRQLTGTKGDPFIGAGGRKTVLIEDYDPCYLPDGGIAFISTRSQQFGRCHGSRYVPSYVLYRADGDGKNIRRLSFNEANEWDPAVLNDGRIIYTRWDYINRHDTNYQSLWVIRPDGTGTGHYYGNYSVGPCMIAEARAIPNSYKVVATATDHHGNTSGSIIVIDPHKGEDGGRPLLCVTPEIGFPERRAPSDTTMTPRPLDRGARRAATPFPLTEDLFLAAYERGGRYAIFLIDTLGGRELIYEDPKASCLAPIPIRPVRKPPAIPSAVAGLENKKTGRFFVQEVYQSRQPIEPGTIKALRVSQIIPQPTRSKPRLSIVNNEIIKRILGTVGVNPDGSVAFEVPASMPLQFQILDANGMAVMTMRSLVYVQPGETAGCVGCHERREDTPLSAARQASFTFHKLTPPAGPRYPGGLSFARTVQPVLDRYCIGCHGLGKNEGKISLIGERSTYNKAYDSLTKRGGMVVIAQRNHETGFSKPKDYFAHAGRLAKMLLDGHRDKQGKPRVKLDKDSFQRIVDWLDLNAQFYGDYSFNRAESQGPSRDGEKALRARVARLYGAEMATQPFPALVNLALVTESRILKAPLAVKAGGWGQITRNGWSGTNDRGYQAMLRFVRACVKPMGRRDIAGTCGSGAGRRGCNCGCCWVRQVRAERQR